MKKQLRFADLLLKMIIATALMTMCQKMKGQGYTNENKGLYPDSFQGTYNPYNTAIGINYSRLSEKWYGGYAGFSNTIDPNPIFNNYDWERKYTVGSLITLPTELKATFHTFVIVGINYNTHSDINSQYILQPGQYEAGLRTTQDVSCDIGLALQVHHFKFSIIYDPFNRFYQFGIGPAFSCFKIW